MQAARILIALLMILGQSTASRAAEKNPLARRRHTPATVLLIRHAEKPSDDESSPHLSADGLQRAAALVELFKPTKRRPDPFPAPEMIFAAKSSKHSQRPLETVAALAHTLKVPVNAQYDDEADVERLAKDLLSNPQWGGKTILICWRQGSLPDLAHKLGATDAPANWKGEVFDRVWQISYSKEGPLKFQDRPQSLLPRDSE